MRQTPTDTDTAAAFDALRMGGDVILIRDTAEKVLARLLDAREASIVLFTLDGGETHAATREGFVEAWDQMYGGSDCSHWEIAIAPVAAVKDSKATDLPGVFACCLFGEVF